MNRILLIASLVLSLGAFALAVHSGAGPEVQPSPAGGAPGVEELARLKVLEQRTAALEESVSRVSSRLSALEARPVAVADGGPVAPASLAAEVAQLRAEVQGMIVGESLSSDSGKAQLKAVVRSVQDELRDEGRRAWAERFARAQTELSDGRAARWKQFAGEMRLSYSQEQQLLQSIQAEDALRKTVGDQVTAGQKNPRDAQRELRQKRQETDEAMQKTLDEAQRAKYEELRREEWRTGRAGGGFRQPPMP